MTRNVSDIYQELVDLSNELEDLARAGRITMSTDAWNKDHQETLPAVRQTINALQVAIDNTRWMETLPPAEPTAHEGS
ncbi:hypothetical protein AARI_30370 [Glutamicibacter arilaitensis Re117]|uniref:Uncharacterized protein n=1 Tax=Glutamicibacter arilaitensis (strain DSM 16368 / CIP 108037 / IAM 15318 / JCM 13566 / NCIMB 14258 / Re117) TaxID=861360 RepID=A0ABP1U5G2_GLUAR|nr:hypothetical protein [Glutamicibacter arilaitensis]CBT77239.1 hypothetical protein AARI_30370 [Glutamicibacter arilaitensis Re117]